MNRSCPSVISLRFRPTILIDIDGVINVNNHPEYWPDLKYGPKEPIAHSPAIIKKINSWSQFADCKMLTSWPEAKFNIMADKVKLKRFPVLPYVNNKSPGKVELARKVMNEIGPDTLLIHIDDHMWHWFNCYNLGNESKEDEAYYERPNTLYLSPFCGLTHAQAQLVDEVLADENKWKGKKLLELEPGGYRRGW